MNRQTLAAAAAPPTPRVAAKSAGWPAIALTLRSPLLIAKSLLNDIVATIVPATCRLCAGPLTQAGNVPVCETCLIHTKADQPAGCRQCGEAMDLAISFEDMRFAQSMADQLLCRECRLAPPAYVRAVSYGTYQGELRGLIGLLKFGRIQPVARILGRRLAETILQLEAELGPNVIVVPVPLHGARRRQRGFNQARLLTAAALRHIRKTRLSWHPHVAEDVLIRQRSTDASFGLSRSGRRRNMAGAFKVVGDVSGQHVLLVDDILTTGATARECARVLVRAGAAKVFVATVARSQKGSIRYQFQDPAEDVALWDFKPTPADAPAQASHGNGEASTFP